MPVTHHVHDVLVGAGVHQDGVELIDAARGALEGGGVVERGPALLGAKSVGSGLIRPGRGRRRESPFDETFTTARAPLTTSQAHDLCGHDCIFNARKVCKRKSVNVL